ncbi:response regulator [Fulvivirga ligni]|uniref:response regulator n=1 Tax=Fulvivirga ligni TaxID=2904246 RepID=UPI001F43688B|nr:response regulator [Fulvivirga ligni]UII22900.1 response regulator [Fulvivirga ligni]
MRQILLGLSLALSCLSVCQAQSSEVLLDTLLVKARGYYSNNDFANAIPYYLQIDSIAEANHINNKTVVQAILDRSEISRSTFTSDGVAIAHELQMLALHKAEELKNRELIYKIYTQLSDMHGLMGNYDSAKLFLDKAFPYYYSESDNHAILARIYTTYGNYYTSVKQNDSALWKLEEGIERLEELGEEKGLAEVLVFYGGVLSGRLENCKAALSPLLRAKAIYEKLDLTVVDRYIYLNEDLAYCYAEVGDHEKAYELAQLAHDKRKAYYKKTKNDITLALETKYQANTKQKEIELLAAKNDLAEQQNENQLLLFIGVIFVLIVVVFLIILLYVNRQKTTKKLQEIDKAKNRFFANISHEFRTPLTLIKGPVEQELKSQDLDPGLKKHLELIDGNANRLLNLVDQLLELTKLDSNTDQLHVSVFSLDEYLKALLSSFYFAAEQKEVPLQYEANMGEPVWLDVSVVEKVVVNLMYNAIKYTPAKEGRIDVKAELSQGNFKLNIGNTGSIPKSDLKHIFDRFYRATKSEEGVGLGLALTKELVQLHKGNIAVTSDNNYTEFTVIIPAHKDAYAASEISEGKGIGGTTIQVNYTHDEVENDTEKTSEVPLLLLVEDNRELRKLLVELFSETFQIKEARNGEEGIKLALEFVPDIIISDIMMPKKNGIELCEELKKDERTSHIPIILLTARAGEENELEGVVHGADDYIVKPFNQDILKARVNNLIELRKQLRSRYSQEVILKPKDLAVTSADEKFLNRLQVLLDARLTEPDFSAENFSKDIGMSRMQLHRKLKALMGVSTTEFIRSQRLKMAADLLEKADVNMSEIAYSVGFNDPSYFTKCFKESYGCTPGQYAQKYVADVE